MLLGIFDDETEILGGKTAVFFGDSIAYGAEDDANFQAWSSRLSRDTGLISNNRAVSGSTIADGVEGRGSMLTRLNETDGTYDYVIMQGGINDVASGITTEEFKTSLEAYFDAAANKFEGAKLGFIITPKCFNTIGGKPAAEAFEPYVAVIKEVCEAKGVAYLDLFNNETLNAEWGVDDFAPDKLHPNASGYEVLLKYIKPWVEAL